MIAAKGFAIKKILKDGKLLDEQGIMGEFDNKKGAKIVELNDGIVKYTELTPNDIMKLISQPASRETLERRIMMLGKKKHSRHHGSTQRHSHHVKHSRRLSHNDHSHLRSVASGHYNKKTHKRRRFRKRKKTHKHQSYRNRKKTFKRRSKRHSTKRGK